MTQKVEAQALATWLQAEMRAANKMASRYQHGSPIQIEWSEKAEKFRDAAQALSALPEAQAMEGQPCEDCGRPSLVWFAPNELWNRVQGGPDATDDPGGMLCPYCFIVKAEATGVKSTAWIVCEEALATPLSPAQGTRLRVGDYPIGTKVYSTIGSHWTRTAAGWQASGGDIFPRYGGDAYEVELPAFPPAQGTVERAEPVAWLTKWIRDGEEWVNAHANEVTAVEEARRHQGTCTPLFASPPVDSDAVKALREAKNLIWRLGTVIEVNIDPSIRKRIADFNDYVDALSSQGSRSDDR